MEALHNIETLIQARYPILYVVTWEERRVEQGLEGICKTRNRQFCRWSLTEGMKPSIGPDFKPEERLTGEIEALLQIKQAPEKTLFLLKDFHVYLKDNRVIRILRDLAAKFRGDSKTIVIMGPSLNLPVELEKDITVVEFPLPTREEIESKLNDVIEQSKELPGVDLTLTNETREALIRGALGLTLDEVESCLALSLVEYKKFAIDVMLEEKKQIIRKSGMLEFYPADVALKDVGGYELLKDWLEKRHSAFTDKAKQFGIPAPKGVLLLGVQGCGKSLVSKSIGAQWNLPILKLDMGRIFGSYVGQSEENMRRAIRVAESVAPCILWLDELEKGLGGTSGPSGDSGATQRVFATFLSWMQEKTKPVFLVATANDVSRLPPELLRKGRFDEIFFIDLPGEKEREDIFAIHLSKRKRDPSKFDLKQLAEKTKGYSGAEVEQLVIASLHSAFFANRELEMQDLLAEAEAQVPLSRMMKEEITDLREWARLRARPSSKHVDD